MKWKEVLVIVCGDGMKVVCANNKSVSVWEFGGGIKSPHARFFPHALANSRKPHANPLFLTPHGALTTLTAHSTAAHGCKESVKGALQHLQSIPPRVTLGVEKKKESLS